MILGPIDEKSREYVLERLVKEQDKYLYRIDDALSNDFFDIIEFENTIIKLADLYKAYREVNNLFIS